MARIHVYGSPLRESFFVMRWNWGGKSMNLMQLRYYISVVETLSFTRAAEMNMIAQPAISYSIKMLEEELGGKLLDRTTRSVSLTPAGEWFYWEAKKLLRQMEAAKEYVRQISNDKYILRIGY